MPEPMAAVDAQTFWMSAKIPNDQFLLYAFAGVSRDSGGMIERLRERAGGCADLCLRIADDCALRYPGWVPAPVRAGQVIRHDETALSWADCLDEVAGLAADQVDARTAAWRLHLFAPVTGAPGGFGPVTVAVVQIAHALADGTRSAELAAWLFGRPAAIPAVPAGRRRGSMVLRGVAAARAHRALEHDIEQGRIQPPPPSRPALSTNARPAGTRRIRTLVRDRAALSRRGTVTVAALVAVGAALGRYLSRHGEDPALLAAEVPMRKPGDRKARNHFGNVGVRLHPGLPPGERAEKIAAELAAARCRSEHPATVAAGRSFAAVPAPLLRWGVRQFDASARSPVVTGHTVVSSVNRGAPDLRLDGMPVVLTAGYPALSPMMGLTHGVHGIGDVVAVSVHAADSAVDVDEYTALLDDALPR